MVSCWGCIVARGGGWGTGSEPKWWLDKMRRYKKPSGSHRGEFFLGASLHIYLLFRSTWIVLRVYCISQNRVVNFIWWLFFWSPCGVSTHAFLYLFFDKSEEASTFHMIVKIKEYLFVLPMHSVYSYEMTFWFSVREELMYAVDMLAKDEVSFPFLCSEKWFFLGLI
mgnify:CR=1 FL=1